MEAPKGAEPQPAAERVGWVTKRVIAAGEPLRAPAVSPPELVKSGQTVDVVWKQGGIELRARGQASRSGAMGERVSVRIQPNRRLEGVVVGPGMISLNPSDRGR